jgi:hypothetical protein
MEEKVIRMPSRKLINEFVNLGVLPYERRNSIKAIEQAKQKLIERTAEFFRRANEHFDRLDGNPPGSPAA